MKCRRLLALLLLLVAANALSLDRDAFTITSYQLNVMVGPSWNGMSVDAKLTLRNDSNLPQKNVTLQVSSSLSWGGVWHDKQNLEYTAEDYISDIDHTGKLAEIVVTLPAPVPPRGTAELRTSYGGMVNADASRFTRIGVPQQVALRNDWDRISESFTAIRGLGYVVWYPVSINAVSLSDGNAVANAIAAWKQRHRNSEFHAVISAESSRIAPAWIALSTPGSELGIQEQRVQNGPGETGTNIWVENHLDLPALNETTPAFAVGNFKALSRPAIELVHSPDHSLIAKDYAIAAEANEPLLKEWLPETGKPVRIIELTDPNATPYQDVASLFAPLLSSTQQNLQLSLLPTQVTARSPSSRAWIQQGLGFFLQAKSAEQREGRVGALRFLERYLQPLAQAEDVQPASESSTKPHRNESANTLLNTSDEIYLRVKAGFVFWMLSDMLGDAPLEKALATYEASGDDDPTQLQKLLQTHSRQNLEWFFDDWVYRDRGLPNFHIVSAVTRSLLTGDAVLVTVTIENRGDAGAEVPVFVHTAVGEKSVRALIKAHEQATVRIEVPRVPTSVVVNDGSVPEVGSANHVYKIETKPQS